MSYLMQIKGNFQELVGALKEEVLKAEDEENVETVFRDWEREGWSFVESQLKRSYRNGRIAANRPQNGPGEAETEEHPKSRFGSWRRKEGEK